MTIVEKLKGGDLRSIGRADEVAEEVLSNPSLFDALFKGLYSNDPVVRMRTADAIEKITRTKPEYLTKYKKAILNDIAPSSQQEVLWHVAQIFPRIRWSQQDRAQVVEQLKRYLHHQSKIVVVSAMQALADLAKQDPSLTPLAVQLIKQQTLSGSPAIQVRGK